MAKKQLLAILHDGTLDGDSSFGVSGTVGGCRNVVKYNSGEILKDLLPRLKKNLIEDFDDDEAIDEIFNAVKGAWIIDKRTQDMLNSINFDFGNDSSCYVANTVLKHVVQAFAIKKLGKKAIGYDD